MLQRLGGTAQVLAVSLLLAAGLVVVGWIDYAATRRELLSVLRQQAASLRQTVAAAARSNRVAAGHAQAQLEARLLEIARFLGDLDREGGLDQSRLDSITARNELFYVTVFDADGERVRTSTAPDSQRAGEGGRGPGGGMGLGAGAGRGQGFGAQAGRRHGTGAGSGQRAGRPGRMAGGMALLDRLLSGDETEAVLDFHITPGGEAARQVAGVRRAGGGAIVLNMDATDLITLQQELSLDLLLADIAESVDDVGYVVLEHSDMHLEHGTVPAPAPASGLQEAGATAVPSLAERRIDVNGRPIIEFSAPVTIDAGEPALLRLGLHLDALRIAERRMRSHLVASLTAALVLAVLAITTVALRQQYGVLSEKHRKAQAALRRRDRLAAMGELASTVAHEVRNPLNSIGMSVQRLRREFVPAGALSDADHEEAVELLEIVGNETRRINGIVQRFLELARPPALEMRETDLASLVLAVVDTSRPMAVERGVTIVASVEGAGKASLDPEQMRQALDNIVRNAIEATPEGGGVSVSASSGPEGHSIEVRDSGHGIDPQHLPRIFDLYFTTKPEGTGVGLAVTHQIVTAHDGTIEVDSCNPTGTCMVVRLPLGAGGGS
jgi:signal transduction histidine kinase